MAALRKPESLPTFCEFRADRVDIWLDVCRNDSQIYDRHHVGELSDRQSCRVERSKGEEMEVSEIDTDGDGKLREASFPTRGAIKGMWRYNNFIISSRVLLV